MAVKAPSIDDLAHIAENLSFSLQTEDLESFRGLMASSIASYSRLDELTEPTIPVKYPRTSGFRPQPEDNPYNAWYWRTEIKGASSGALKGKSIAIKDNVCVAGVPMMNGCAVLEGYVPESDATIVTRILDAGGTILGKAVCENLCLSGGSHTAATGPVRNPHNEKHTTGGSSSGSGALVAARIVDMAIGGDQGGSIRMPSCWCGIYGHKPTYGLVPYTGAFPIELTLDHVGPMARTVADVALLLEVIAGPDGLDPRQHAGLKGEAYTKALTGNVKGLRLGVVKEGFGWPGLSEKDVDRSVEQAAQKFTKLGATVKTISIPWHREGIHLFTAIAAEGATMLMVLGNSMGTNWKGHYTTSLLDAFARGRLTRANDLSETVKLFTMLGVYMQERYHGRYYAKAQNLGRLLAAAYNTAFRDFDLLVMPTLPLKATKIPAANASREEYVTRALEMLVNTCPFDITGHPAITVPCGMSEGLPVGMMLVGRMGEDATVLRAAGAFEKQVYAAPVPRGVK